MGFSNHKQSPDGVVDKHGGCDEEHTESGDLRKLQGKKFVNHGLLGELDGATQGRGAAAG